MNRDECPVVTAVQRQQDESIIRRALVLDEHSRIAYVDEGWDSRVYVVNGGEAVFKFPRAPRVIAQYRHEIAALRLLEDLDTGVPTPRVRWVGPDLGYFGYVGVVGEPLSVGAVLEPDVRKAAGAALGRLLRTLHDAHLDGAPSVNVDEEISIYAGALEHAMSTLVAAFSTQDKRRIETFILGELPDEMRRLGGVPKLSHADLGPWNLIVGPDRSIGVIDLGDVAYYDESKDFSGFNDELILRTALDAYGADDLLREKAALRIKALPVLDLPFSLGKGDQRGVDACLDLVRRRIVGADPIDGRAAPGRA